MAEIVIKSYDDLPPPDRSEILRYCRAASEDAELSALIDECIEEVGGVLRPRVVSKEYLICREETVYDLGFVSLFSRDLDRALLSCNYLILFVASVGVGADRLISKYARVSPARALVTDAVCTERVEALCNAFEAEVTSGVFSRPRYSPGYGDVPLDVQKNIFRALSPEKHIGVTLNESMLMSPTKSVSAFIGIRR